MQEKIIDNIEAILAITWVVIMLIYKIFKAIKVPFRKIYLYWLMKTNYDGPVPGAIRTLFDSASVCFSHDNGEEIISELDAEQYLLQYKSMVDRMYRAGCDSGRDFIVSFKGLTKVNEHFESVYYSLAEYLKADDLVSIYYIIPPDVKGLKHFRNKCNTIQRPTFHVVETRADAPD